MTCMDKHGMAEQIVRSVIGQVRKISQCMVFDDSHGKSVTVRYVGVPEKRAAQIEAIKIVKAFHDGGYEDYKIRLFVTDMDSKNVGVLEVDATAKTFGFHDAGIKWVGAALPMEETPPLTPPRIRGGESDEPPFEISREKMGKLVTGIQRVSDAFRKFYGVPKIDGTAFTPPEDSEE